ncbi:CDP-alcohol phosphatidyltransferase family protein [Jannaschia pohangensis]|uniref:Phosphatidylglycerophosphate synthase n=1 Tax=Jannaschia pohangensis TaxID=390807 RepID=A0A1I3TB34_9RHOB|nr:CDP-alcohol phosphatidyltransferase family protein [Jannaschia pohangensis]SFJ66886.1 Phosphatidylglycerophosphate synthase [Jannaschia pohangensis]
MENRRPLASRQTGWAAFVTRRLAATSITPNQVSGFSVLAAALAGLAFAAVDWVDGGAELLVLGIGAACVQLRLLCNLFDGMLAVEAGRGSPTGAFWNEVPDRPADMLILVGVGIGAGVPWLGWAAAALAVFVAYLRAFGQSLGQAADYRGPMAKQHRMAMVTVAAVAGIVLSPWMAPATLLALALWLIVAGSGVTAARRGMAIRDGLAQASAGPDGSA